MSWEPDPPLWEDIAYGLGLSVLFAILFVLVIGLLLTQG